MSATPAETVPAKTVPITYRVGQGYLDQVPDTISPQVAAADRNGPASDDHREAP
jgi:hypothetical protein